MPLLFPFTKLREIILQTTCIFISDISFIPVTNFTMSLAKLGVLYYYTVAEMHVFVRSRRMSAGKSITCTQVSQSIDNHLVD